MLTGKDWALLLAGLFGGFVLTIIASLIHPSILGFISARKTKRLHKRKTDEWKNYRRIKALKEGNEDKYVFYIFCAAVAICFVVLAVGCVILFFVVDEETIKPLGPFAALVAGILVLLALLLFASMAYTETNLQDFENYERKVREKWGLPED